MPVLTYDRQNFLMDGKPYQIISGAMHYFRIVPQYWEDRLKKLKACGFNTAETYICWNLHERREGEFDFEGYCLVNGFNIGRYFNSAGPQKTLYIPAPLLKTGDNEIIVFETDNCADPVVEFVDSAELG